MPNQDKSKIILYKQVNPNLSYKMFKWYEIGYLGVGKKGLPFFDMSKWIDMDKDIVLEAEAEITAILGKFKMHWWPKTGAYIPEDINGAKWLNYYVWNAEREIPDDIRLGFTKPIDISNWVYSQGLIPPDWSQMAYIMRPGPGSWASPGNLILTKMGINGEWIEETPVLKHWIESWNIFDDIGRIVIFQNSPGVPVGIHRDAAYGLNAIHNVSIQFTKNRPTFIYDEKTKEKIYHRTRAYCFNVTDCHGVDATDDNVYTIRIDGIFKPDVCEAMGLYKDFIWMPQYKSAEKIQDIQIFEPDERP